MKILLLTCFLLTCLSLCFGQSAAVAFKFGTQTILIPTPDGMIDEFGKNREITTNIKALMEPNFGLLAVYETKEDALRRQKGGSGPPGFYACVGTVAEFKDFDITPSQFDLLVTRDARHFPLEVDPKNKELIALLDRAEKGLIGAQPAVFGWFDKQPNSYSMMMLTGWNLVGVPVVGANVTSYIYLKKRIAYLTTFRIVNDMNDVVTLTDFEKKWIAQIKAANK